MVAKINRGASLYGAVIYNQQKVNAWLMSLTRAVEDQVLDCQLFSR